MLLITIDHDFHHILRMLYYGTHTLSQNAHAVAVGGLLPLNNIAYFHIFPLVIVCAISRFYAMILLDIFKRTYNFFICKKWKKAQIQPVCYSGFSLSPSLIITVIIDGTYTFQKTNKIVKKKKPTSFSFVKSLKMAQTQPFATLGITGNINITCTS